MDTVYPTPVLTKIEYVALAQSINLMVSTASNGQLNIPPTKL
jgi:hypothetical protein